MKNLVILLAVIAAAYILAGEFRTGQTGSSQAVPNSNAALEQAFQNRSHNLQIQGAGKVVQLLPDDNKGARHQRFILQTDSGLTLLVAHNIDLAPRVKGLAIGDRVEFYGEYEWNAKGGVIHWTHHDPQGRHAHGWLLHRGKHYR